MNLLVGTRRTRRPLRRSGAETPRRPGLPHSSHCACPPAEATANAASAFKSASTRMRGPSPAFAEARASRLRCTLALLPCRAAAAAVRNFLVSSRQVHSWPSKRRVQFTHDVVGCRSKCEPNEDGAVARPSWRWSSSRCRRSCGPMAAWRWWWATAPTPTLGAEQPVHGPGANACSAARRNKTFEVHSAAASPPPTA